MFSEKKNNYKIHVQLFSQVLAIEIKEDYQMKKIKLAELNS